ncbi:PAS domain-containing protein [Paenibacillus sepulcri]|uniref:PAS domain-containing protein n=1 Tax=Paenibacillus sepulcri TaxID=359917 RepID=UPI0035EC6337
MRSTLESIQDGYYEMNESGHFSFFNHALVKILGVSEVELHEKRFTDFMSKEDARKTSKRTNGCIIQEPRSTASNGMLFSRMVPAGPLKARSYLYEKRRTGALWAIAEL